MNRGGFIPILFVIICAVIGIGAALGTPYIYQAIQDGNFIPSIFPTPSTTDSTSNFDGLTESVPASPTTLSTSSPITSPKSTSKTTTAKTPTPKPALQANNVCEVNILTDSSSTTSVKLVAANNSSNGSTIAGAQWDFEGNGSWDTDMNLSNLSISRAYSDGSHTAKLQLRMSDGSTTAVCSKSFTTPNGFTVSLTGTVYEDANCNDMREPSEKGLSGVIVQITNMDGTYSTLATLTSDSSGFYRFSYVLSGNNFITVRPNDTPLDNYGIWQDNHTTSLSANQRNINMDLGQIPSPVGEKCEMYSH